MKKHRIGKATFVGFLLGIISIVCMGQVIRGPVTSTPFTRSLLDDTSASEARTTLGISGSTNYTFNTAQFTVTGTNDVNLMNGLTISNVIVKTAMTNDFATASRALFTDANKKVVSSTVTTTELELLQGVTTQPAGTNLFQANQFDIRSDNIGIKSLAIVTNLLVEDGSISAPAIAFKDDTDTGFARLAGNTFSIVTAGTRRWDVLSTGHLVPFADNTYNIGQAGVLEPAGVYAQTTISTTGTLESGAGSASLPGIYMNNDTDSGVYQPGADAVGIATAGTGRWQVDANGHIVAIADNNYDIGADGATRPRDIYAAGELRVGDGAVGAPSVSFDADEDTGLYRIGADILGVSAGGSLSLRVDTTKTEVNDTDVHLQLEETDGAVDEKISGIRANGGSLDFYMRDDAENFYFNWMEVERTGTDLDHILLLPDGADSGDTVSIGYPTLYGNGRLSVKSSSNGDIVFRLEGESGGGLGDIVENAYMARIETTDATVSTLHSFVITANRTYLIEARVTARRTGGASGTADDGAVYIRRAMVTTKSGTVTINAVDTELTQEDQVGWDCTFDVSGNNIRVRVTGAANNTIDWGCKVTTQSQGIGG
jgi:hypothetical protein